MFVFVQAEDGIRDLVRSRGLGDVYKRQVYYLVIALRFDRDHRTPEIHGTSIVALEALQCKSCLLYTSDAADERSSVDLGGRRIIKKKKKISIGDDNAMITNTGEPYSARDRCQGVREEEEIYESER